MSTYQNRISTYRNRRADRFIASCTSWDDFCRRMASLTNKEKGDAFERFVQLYLQTAPEYRSMIGRVWHHSEVPPEVRKRLKLPTSDEGIDHIAIAQRREYWSIQAKWRDPDATLTRAEVSTFLQLSFNTCDNISRAIIAHPCERPIRKRRLMRKTMEIGPDRFATADWSLIVAKLQGKTPRLFARKPKRHQEQAIEKAKEHFIDKNQSRGRMLMPCGTGKSLTAWWIAEETNARTIAVVVPSLGLIRQGVAEWTREFLAKGEAPSWICVCSDETVGKVDQDEFVGEVYEVGLPVETDPDEIANVLRGSGKARKIIFTTYQSSDKLAAAARRARVKLDLVIFDEAHRTIGDRSRAFATLLSDRKLKARHRLFMTATEKVFIGDNGNMRMLSMDNEADYGKRFFEMTFKDAIDQGIICDYKILTIVVSDQRVAKAIRENRLVTLNARNLREAEPRQVATGIALKRVEKKFGVTHTFSFHPSILAAKRFRSQQDDLNRLGPRTVNLHVSSKMSAGERANALSEFESARRALMTNARCLIEGVDAPVTDCVVFAEPKRSKIDIVQAAGRAMRIAKGKDYGYILLPIIVPRGMSFEEFAESTPFRRIARIIGTLATQDDRITDQFMAIEQGRIPSGKVVEISGDVPLGMQMPFAKFSDAVSARIWETVARMNWRPFEEARKFAWQLKLKSVMEWNDYCKSDSKPADIPTSPAGVYDAWVDWSDWLGIRKRSGWRPFAQARIFVQKLGLKGKVGWEAYCATGKLPKDIPFSPARVYGEWVNWRDWLGTGISKGLDSWRPFEEARAIARSLGLKSYKEWRKFARSSKKPLDIPIGPHGVYADAGWAGWPDWLGNGKQVGEWRPFEEARTFVRKLKLNSVKEWQRYHKSGKKPLDIPADPMSVYANAGWVNWGNWLGTGRARQDWWPFKKARAYVRKLGLRNWVEWKKYYKSGKKPDGIPCNPTKAYRDEWVSVGDWLGKVTRLYRYDRKSFKKARAFARKLGLTTSTKWTKWARSSKRPLHIPVKPNKVYAGSGWAGWPDWLGKSP